MQHIGNRGKIEDRCTSWSLLCLRVKLKYFRDFKCACYHLDIAEASAEKNNKIRKESEAQILDIRNTVRYSWSLHRGKRNKKFERDGKPEQRVTQKF